MPSVGSRPVYLVGMMGAGRLGRRCVDLDVAVAARAGEPVEAMIRDGREAVFRAHEAAALRELSAEGCVVATGGGTPVDPASRAHMLEHGRVVYLRATVDVERPPHRLAHGLALGQRNRGRYKHPAGCNARVKRRLRSQPHWHFGLATRGRADGLTGQGAPKSARRRRQRFGSLDDLPERT